MSSVTFQVIAERGREVHAASVAEYRALDGQLFVAVDNAGKAKSGGEGGDTVVLCHFYCSSPFLFGMFFPC